MASGVPPVMTSTVSASVGRLAAGEAEVQHLRAGRRADDDVGRFQIAVDHAALVRVGDGAGDLDAITDELIEGQAVVRDHFRERLPVDVPP